MKLLPFDIEKIRAGAKCVVIPDKVQETTSYSDTIYPFQCKINGRVRLFNDRGEEFNDHDKGIRLAILDESEAEAETPKESFWRLLEIGERILATDGWYYLGSKNWSEPPANQIGKLCSGEYHVRRRVTIPATESPWIRYEDRKPTREDGDKYGDVLAKGNDYTCRVAKWSHVQSNEIWMPIPPLPKLKRDFQKEFVEKLTESGSGELWKLLNDEEKARVQKQWEAENQ